MWWWKLTYDDHFSICTYVKSLCCTLENNIIYYVNCIPMKNSKNNIDIHRKKKSCTNKTTYICFDRNISIYATHPQFILQTPLCFILPKAGSKARKAFVCKVCSSLPLYPDRVGRRYKGRFLTFLQNSVSHLTHWNHLGSFRASWCPGGLHRSRWRLCPARIKNRCYRCIEFLEPDFNWFPKWLPVKVWELLA